METILDLLTRDQLYTLCTMVCGDTYHEELYEYIKLFEDLTENYTQNYSSILPVLIGKREINTRSLDTMVRRVLYALLSPFDEIPLMMHYQVPKSMYINEPRIRDAKDIAFAIEADFRAVCQFRLKVGK